VKRPRQRATRDRVHVVQHSSGTHVAFKGACALADTWAFLRTMAESYQQESAFVEALVSASQENEAPPMTARRWCPLVDFCSANQTCQTVGLATTLTPSERWPVTAARARACGASKVIAIGDGS